MGQMIVADYFTNHYKEHILNVRAGLRRKCDALTAALQEHFGHTAGVEQPRGGIYLWVKLPEGVDCRQFVGPAMQEGIGFIPGPDWSADPEAAANYIRLCFALPREAEVWEGIEKLARVFQLGGGKV